MLLLLLLLLLFFLLLLTMIMRLLLLPLSIIIVIVLPNFIRCGMCSTDLAPIFCTSIVTSFVGSVCVTTKHLFGRVIYYFYDIDATDTPDI